MINNYTYRRLNLGYVNSVIEILHQEQLRYSDGTYPEEKWISDLIDRGTGYGMFDEEFKLIGVVLSESLLSGGEMIWMVAFSTENTNKGLGKLLMEHYIKYVKLTLGKKWLYGTSTEKAFNFYQRFGATSLNKPVFEMTIDLDNFNL